MKRHPNQVKITQLVKSNFPDTILFVDCESKQKKLAGNTINHSLWFGCALAWKLSKSDRNESIEETAFTNALEFWLWAIDYIGNKQAVYLFAHNLKFDFMVLDGFRLLAENGFILKSIYHKFTTTVMKFSNGEKTIQVADTMNYFQTSLAKLAPMVGEKKIETDFDNPNKKEIMQRCKSDVVIIYKAVRLIIDKLQKENLGGFKITAPSISFSIFRSRFMKGNIITHHNNEAVAIEKNSYYGGYVQVFKLFEQGKPDLYKLDINAMYPSVMLKNKYPIMLQDIYKEMSLAKFRGLLSNGLVTANVILDTNEAVYPYRHSTGVYYPTGVFETTLTTPSLVYAFQRGHIIKVNKVITYLSDYIFDEFVTYMYNQRRKAQENQDITGALFYKTMMNSLYGKFGQVSSENKIIGVCEPDLFESYHGMDVSTGETFREILAGGSVIQLRETGESRYTFYSIAAHVTDYARMKLFSLIRKAGRNNVFYSDTDSLVVNELGFSRLSKYLHPNKLGYLKIEDTGNVFIGFAKKDYLLGDKRKLKGFTREPVKGKPHIFKAIQSSSFYGAMSRNETSGTYWRMIEKIHNPYVKGCTIDIEGNVIPSFVSGDNKLFTDKIFTVDIIKKMIERYADKNILRSLSKWI
jgi:DNA polymerase family B